MHSHGDTPTRPSDPKLDSFWVSDHGCVPVPYNNARDYLPMLEDNTNLPDSVGNDSVNARQSVTRVHGSSQRLRYDEPSRQCF
jgi:hypothetical protein